MCIRDRDYLATAGLHVDVDHWVETEGYTLSITYRVQKSAARGKRHIGSITRQPAVAATTDTDPKGLSEVRQELNQTMEGQAILSQQLKDALDRIAANKPKKNPTGNEVIRSKIDSGACDPVINPEVGADYPLEETEASKRGIAYVSASGDPMPNHGERVLVVKKPSGRIVAMRNQVTPCTGPLTSVAKMIDANKFVGFCSLGSFILDLETNEVDWLERVDDCFEIELEVLPYKEAKPLLESSGFQGRR